nr:putative reverse transcriptase domain, zinc finger, CCHC-type, aspartic peptidase domain protein [Tanacetum cinerariifolium]
MAIENPKCEFKMEIEYLKDEMYNHYNNEKLVWYYLTFDERERLSHEVKWQCNLLSSGISFLQEGELSSLAVRTSSGSGNSSLAVGMP